MWQGSLGQKYTEALDRNFTHLSKCLANSLPTKKDFIHSSYFEHWSPRKLKKYVQKYFDDVERTSEIKQDEGCSLSNNFIPAFTPPINHPTMSFFLSSYQPSGRHSLKSQIVPAFWMSCLFLFWTVFTIVVIETFWYCHLENWLLLFLSLIQ